MGGICSGGTKGQNTKLEEKSNSEFSRKLKSKKSFGKQKGKPNNHTSRDIGGLETKQQRYDSVDVPLSFSSKLKPSRTSTTPTNRVSQKSSFLGRAGTVGIEKAVEVLDTLGSSMSNLHTGSRFISGVVSRGNRISILAFEVANTIAKGSNLMQLLSEENIQFLKTVVFGSEGVQKLVSKDMNELLKIAGGDKRDELDVFSREVIRFGDLCKEPQWHNLGRYFSMLDTDDLSHKQLTKEAETSMKELVTLAQYTSELYHELNALDRFEQDYRQKVNEAESLNLPKRGEGLTILQSELKQQRKLVRSLKKKSLWCRTLEEIMGKLVNIVSYMHQAISKAFGGIVLLQRETGESPQRLGAAGLALHYANVINQIDSMASRPGSLPPNTRDTLYQALPVTVKKALRSHLQSVDMKEDLSISQVKDEMEKTLCWLVPVAANTTKAHQGFGWVGEWANNGNEFSKNAATNNNLARLQTLYHADKQKTDAYILELVMWLHHLISLARQRDHGFKLRPMPLRSSTFRGPDFHSRMRRVLSVNNISQTYRIELSQEDRHLLDNVSKRRLIRGVSKSQHFDMRKAKAINRTLSRSAGYSPPHGLGARQL